MCMICVAIPATAAVGAKLNASQLNKPHKQRKPITTLTSLVIFLLVVTSAIYHTLLWEN